MVRLFSALSLLLISFATLAQPSGPMISEIVEGSGNNRAIELFNPTNAAINLADYELAIFLNGSTIAAGTMALAATSLAPGDTWVVVNNDAQQPATNSLLAKADQLDSGFVSATYFTGNDALVLRHTSGTYVDVFGVVGENPGQGWSNDTGLVVTQNHTLIRNANVAEGLPGSPAAFDAAEWIVLPENTFDSLGSHQYTLPLALPAQPLQTTVKVFPNPATSNWVKLTAQQPIIALQCASLDGRQVPCATQFSGNVAELSLQGIPRQPLLITVQLADNTRHQQLILR